jgi:hypothetical protein
MIIQNKVRPGVYIEFEGIAENRPVVGTRGVVAMPLALDFSDPGTIVRMTASEYSAGNSYQNFGLLPTDTGIFPIRETFKNASELVIYALGSGGAKAGGTLFTTSGTEALTITATAAKTGVFGNKITVSSVTNGTKFDLITTIDGTQVDKQTISTLGEYENNGFFVISGGESSTPLQEFAGVTLSGGENPTVNEASWQAAFTALASEPWNVLAVCSLDTSLPPLVKDYIFDLRENQKHKSQAVVYDYDADYEGIISVDQGYKIGTQEIPAETAIAYVAGATAGAQPNMSNTYHVILGATEIIGEKTNDEIIDGLKSGKFMFTKRQDRQIVFEKDINTLHTLTATRTYPFTKNRTIRVLDGLATQITTVAENNYIGKVHNTIEGRNLLKSAIVDYMNSLVAIDAIGEFDSAGDITIEIGNDAESVAVTLAITVIDTMEKIYFTVFVVR